MSNRIRVRSEVRVYERDGVDLKVSDSGEPVIVESHHIYQDHVVLTVDGKNVTVVAPDLIAAIKNAQNANG